MCTFYNSQVKELYKTEPCPDTYHRISRSEPPSCPADKQPLVSWTHVAGLLIGQLYSFGVAEPLDKLRLIGIRNGSATLVLNLFSSSSQLITFLLSAPCTTKVLFILSASMVTLSYHKVCQKGIIGGTSSKSQLSSLNRINTSKMYLVNVIFM